jgi:hypothetical protein
MKQLRGIAVTFCGVVFSLCGLSAAIVINEIHYDPDVKTEPAEFIELHNAGTSPVNLAGWTLSDGGNLNFAFPATNVAPGGFVVVAQNPAFLQTKYSVTGVIGPLRADGTTSLSKYGEKLTLRTPAGQIEDVVEFKLGFPWPTVGDANVPGQGNSIELINPSLDNDLGGSWRASGSGSGTPVQNATLVSAQSVWKYLKGTNVPSSPVTAWRQPGFNDATWSSGQLPIGYGEVFTNTPLDDMNGLYTSVFLRKQFTVTDPAQFTRLVLEAQYDDGFKCWINGVLVVDGNANMAPGEVAYNGTALSAIENLNFVTFNLSGSPASLLVNGNNTIAVQAHNSSLAASTDFFFDARLLGQTGGSSGVGPSPGRVNTVYATNAPPQIRQVEHTPEQPHGGQTVLITAKVTDPDGVGSVLLEYQIVSPGNYIELTNAAYTNLANWISLPMNDAGTAGDLVAGDDVFSAQIPASVQVHRRLIRYRITVADTGGRSVRVPYADDPQPNFAYFVYNGVPAWTGAVQPGSAGSNGVVFSVSSNEMNRLPVYQLLAQSNSFANCIGWAPGTVNNQYGGDNYLWTGALIVDGKVYDHIGLRCRGGVWRYSMGKNAMKFRLNRGHDLEVKDNWGRKLNAPWRRLSFRPNIQQGDFNHRGEQGMFESVGFRLFELTGAPGLNTVQIQFRVIDDAREAVPGNQFESDFYGVWLAVEEDDGRYLQERDLPDGNMYDMEGGSGTLNNIGPFGPLDKSDLNYLLTYGAPSPTETWWRTNLNLQAYYSYQTIVQGIHHYDIADGKNYFYYKNPVSRLWRVLPWDLDLTWADNMYRSDSTRGDEPFRSRVISNFASPGTFPALSIEFRNRVREIRDLLFNNEEGFKLIDEYAWITRGSNRPSIIDADRAMWDYNPVMINTAIINSSKAGQGRFYQWPNEPTVSKTFDGCVQLMKNYVNYRSTNASLNGSSTGLDGVAADAARPARPTLAYTGPASYPINRLSFRSSAYSGVNPFGSMRWRVAEISYFNPATYDPEQPLKYEIEAPWDSGAISNFNADVTVPANYLRVGSRYRARVQFADSTGRTSNWSVPHEFTCGEPGDIDNLLAYLRVTEVMYHPPPGGFEYVELHNISPTVTLDLSGVKFTQGIDFVCLQSTTLPPLGYLLVVGTPDFAAFRAFYGLDESVHMVGPFDGGLANGGEQLTLRTAAGGSDIVEFNFGDGRGWPPQADGAGHSLVLLDSALGAEGTGAGEYSGNWRASTWLRGSAGRADTAPPPSVLLNEIVAHTDDTNGLASNDWIELYNPTAANIPLGPGWYLSDDGSTYDSLKKWEIPAATVVPAHGYVTFDEATGFHYPTNTGFGISKAGEQIFLSYLPGTAQDRIADAVSFKGQENDWSLGRYPDGGPFWYALGPRTRGTANAPPPARLVVSEILYHPPDTYSGTNAIDNPLDEFIELFNATPNPLTLQNTNGTWRLNGGVEFDFPTNLTLNAGEYLLVVNFDPATNAAQLNAFKSLYGITDPLLVILGPYGGKLANNSDRVAIERPQHGDGTNDPLNWVVVDEVIYADQSPFPCGSDGSGNSLQRLSALQHGCDPANWSGEPPTAGRPRANLPPGLPAFTAPPRDQIVATNGTATFSVSVCGSPPFTYQWRRNGMDIANATNATLTLPNVLPAQSGSYDVVVTNPAGTITSPAAMLVVQYPPFIMTDPQPATAVRDLSAMFSVTAGGTAPFNYEWRFNGAGIPGATNSSLLISPVRTNDAGLYSVRVNNTAGSTVSASAPLTVLIPATILQQPTNRSVTLTANMTNVSFKVEATGTGTLLYQWSFNDAIIPWGTEAMLTLTNVKTSDAGQYRVVVTDTIGSAISSNALLTVLVVPRFLTQSGSQSAVAGGSVTFSGSVTGFPPPFTFELRNPSTNIQVKMENEGAVFFRLNNLTTNETRTYRIVVKNLAGPTTNGIASSTFNLTVLADSDGDGIPDIWESSFGFNPTNAVDGSLDADGDGMSNLAEYIAGTDPTDSLSYLKVDRLQTVPGSNVLARIEFNAVSNRTYSVQFSPSPATGPWTRFADVVATSSNRPVVLFDPQPATVPMRAYRLVTPATP